MRDRNVADDASEVLAQKAIDLFFSIRAKAFDFFHGRKSGGGVGEAIPEIRHDTAILSKNLK